jgi:hypothetical protein
VDPDIKGILMSIDVEDERGAVFADQSPRCSAARSVTRETGTR